MSGHVRFSDEHINEAIPAAARATDLKVFIVDPGGVNVIDKRDKTATISLHREEFQEVLETRLIGISTRPISSTFNDDTVEKCPIK